MGTAAGFTPGLRTVLTRLKQGSFSSVPFPQFTLIPVKLIRANCQAISKHVLHVRTQGRIPPAEMVLEPVSVFLRGL